jgi:hypothetical protein
MELWLRIAAHADVAYIGGVDQAWHREHSASLSTKAEHPLIILSELRAAFDELFAGLGPDYPNAAELDGFARRAVATHALVEASRLLDRGRPTNLVDDLRSFALETDGDLAESRNWTRFENRRRRSGQARLLSITGFLPRLQRRFRERRRVGRWHRSGVYEPLMIIDLPTPTIESSPAATRPRVSTS